MICRHRLEHCAHTKSQLGNRCAARPALVTVHGRYYRSCDSVITVYHRGPLPFPARPVRTLVGMRCWGAIDVVVRTCK